MLYAVDSLATPSTEVREAFMGFRVGDTAGLDLSELRRFQLLGYCTDLNNAVACTISTIRTHMLPAEQGPKYTPSPTHRSGGFTSSMTLPGVMDIPFLPPGRPFTLPSAPLPTPTPRLWTFKYEPKQWVYTDVSDIKGQSPLRNCGDTCSYMHNHLH
jgi:hypothetical protein